MTRRAGCTGFTGRRAFPPQAWLHRSRNYVILAVAVSIGAFALQLILGPAAFSYILLYVGAVYWIMAPQLYRHARRIVKSRPAQSQIQPT